MTSSEAAKVWKVLQALASELDRDAPLMQALALARIAMAGEVGLDQSVLMDDLKASSASTSRTVQALSSVHYLKDRAGYGLVERIFDASDNRRRTLKLTTNGRRAIDKVVGAIGGNR